MISKQLDDFRERHQPQLGRVHDPLGIITIIVITIITIITTTV